MICSQGVTAVSKEEQEKTQKLVLAFLGMTKSGKTTGIAALTGYPESIIEISTGDEGRTKVTVEYHFSGNDSEEIEVEDVEFYKQTIMMSADGSSRDRYNEDLEKNTILRNILKLRKVVDGENLQESISLQLDQLKKTLKQRDIKSLINTEGIDKYIKKITLKVKANNELQPFILKNRLDLYIRDTRGLMDIVLEDDNGVKKITNVRPLSELGLDGINGVLFYCSESYPNIVSSIYEDTFTNVFQSVPFFLIARDNGMRKLFRSNSQPETFKNVRAMVRGIQVGENKNYSDVEYEYFIETLALLEKFKVTERNNEGDYQFKGQYFKQMETEFLSSSCISLKKARLKREISDISKDTDFLFFQYTVTVAVQQMVDMISELHMSINSVIQSGKASGILREAYESFVAELQNDLQKYDNWHTSNEATEYVKPQFTTMSKFKLGNDLTNPSCEILGKYGGITTQSNGKLRYAATAVVAVTSRKSLYRLIEKIQVETDVTDLDGNVLIPVLKGDCKKQEALLKKTLYYILYNAFTDTNATIQYYLIVDRYNAKNSIINVRQNKIAPEKAVEESIKGVLDRFCILLDSIENISSMFTN